MVAPTSPVATPTVADLAFDALCALCETEDETVPEQLRPRAHTVLGDMLIQRAVPTPPAILDAVDKYYDAAVAQDDVALAPTPTGLPDARWLSIGKVHLCVWRGDIRRLAVGAVVNAANEG